MGIDIYMEWKGQSQEQKKAQITGFSTVSGHVGYLREAYHGGPYATKVLLRECWEDEAQYPDYTDDTEDAKYICKDCGAHVDLDDEDRTDHFVRGLRLDAELLEQRLDEVLRTIIRRATNVYNYNEDTATDDERAAIARVQQSYRNFVALARSKQDELGEPVRIYASY